MAWPCWTPPLTPSRRFHQGDGHGFIAAFISWIRFVIAGLHFKILLCALVFFLVLTTSQAFAGMAAAGGDPRRAGSYRHSGFAAAYGLFVLLIDAVLKPVLIAKSGGRLPFLVLFIGVIGGLAAWGFTGMFKGAIILAVFYTVFNSWLARKDQPKLSRNRARVSSCKSYVLKKAFKRILIFLVAAVLVSHGPAVLPYHLPVQGKPAVCGENADQKDSTRLMRAAPKCLSEKGPLSCGIPRYTAWTGSIRLQAYSIEMPEMLFLARFLERPADEPEDHRRQPGPLYPRT